MSSKREERAWAAGIFDGEGTAATSIDGRGKCPYLRVNLSVYQAGEGKEPPQILSRFKEIVGVGYITGPNTRPSGFRKKPMWVFSVQNFKDFKKVVTVLWPWLCEPKKDQLAGVLDKIDEYEVSL